MQNRMTDHFSDNKPIVLMIYTTQDGNGAFTSSAIIDKLCADDRFHVLYYEISEEQALFGRSNNIFREALAKGGSPNGNKLILAGHGRSDRLILGASPFAGGQVPNESDTEKFGFDVMDFTSDDFSALLEFLGPSGEWLNYSCSNGYGLASNPDNLANHCAMVVPSNVRLNFMKISDNIFTFTMDENGDFDIEFATDLPYELYGKAGSGE
jgi:hypothetical protein